VDHGLQLVAEGADILDIGGESSRPGAAAVSVSEELKRVIPVIKGIRKITNVPISIDTTKASVAEQAIIAGANWVNDISGLRWDPDMISVVRKLQVPVVVMHMQGTPRTMQKNPHYNNVCLEVDNFFEERIRTLNSTGITRIILDPGIGFGKRLEDNIDLIRGATLFRRHGYPLLYGSSRKSFIGKITGKPVDERLAGSLASLVNLQAAGVNIFRIHDVAASKDFLAMIKLFARKSGMRPNSG
jgi:dihydropteroate synthase